MITSDKSCPILEYFSGCSGIVIADYSEETDDGSIEFIYDYSNNYIFDHLSAELLADTLMKDYPGVLPEEIETIFNQKYQMFHDNRAYLIEILPNFPNLTELELENFADYSAIDWEKLTKLEKLSLYNCNIDGVSYIDEIMKSNAEEIYLYDCNISENDISILSDSGKKVMVVNGY